MNWFELVEKWDSQLLLAINGLNSPFFDEIMWGVSNPVFGIPFYLFFAYLFFRQFGLKATIIICGLIALTVGISDQISVHCFKEVFERLRPSHDTLISENLHYYLKADGDFYIAGGEYGFISSHASNMFSIATMVYLIVGKNYKWLVWLLLIWASLIGYSRIYLGVHYPTDVFVGAIVGCAIAGILYYLSKQFNWIKC